MNYPAEYIVLEAEEMTYLEGGSIYTVGQKVFDTLYKSFANKCQAQFMNSLRGMVWNCLQQQSLQPVEEFGKDFMNLSLAKKVTFLYGGYIVGKTTVELWNA